MQRWQNRVAVVTGASVGIGRAISLKLAANRMKVVATGRNLEQLESLREEHSKQHSESEGQIYPVQCDLRQEADILSLFDRVVKEHGGVDVCVNNAGLSKTAPLLSGSTDDWREMLNVNVLGLSICCRESVKSMRSRNVDDGYIINICSMGGHRLGPRGNASNFYCATKFAVNALTEGLRSELRGINSHIRVSQMSPGRTETEFFERAQGKEKANELLQQFECLTAEDIADCVVFTISPPPRVEIKDIMIRPTEQPM